MDYFAANSYNVRNVNTDGTLNNNNAYNGNRGVRPLWWIIENEYQTGKTVSHIKGVHIPPKRETVTVDTIYADTEVSSNKRKWGGQQPSLYTAYF